MGGEISNDTSYGVLKYRIYKELVQLNTKNKQKETPNNPIKNWAEDLNRHFIREQSPIDLGKGAQCH